MIKQAFLGAACFAFLASLTTAIGTAQSAVPPYHPGTSHQQPGPAWADRGHALIHRPYPWGSVSRPYPLVSASFRRPMEAQSIRVTLDGFNVTKIARVTAMGFEFTPAFPLHAGVHVVRISGETQNGNAISDGWDFTVTP
ncbi:MAG: hypothetical protein ACREMP_06940 [Candidatus Tyrphobacter sp.]